MSQIPPRLLLAAALAMPLVAGCPSGPSSSGGGAAGDAGHGRQVFTTTCTTCHGTDARGVKGLGKSLVESTWLAKASDDVVVALIEHGRDASDPLNTTGVAMPPRGGNAALTDADVRDVVAYLRTLGKS